jgi:2-succinyl-5-enolpyruvyl-6-hydroxy-3-cyclohexene-1-carboxylate synthase
VRAANLLGEWARLLVETLARAGVERAVLSPGSRSTPFAWAALHCERLSCDVVVDERSAGFFAVGQAKQSGAPTLLVCTSGTAAVNYFPAVVEASLSYTPLIVLTADRPFELQHVAAAQTIDQQKLYGRYAREFVELGLPDDAPAALRGLARCAAQAVFRTLHPEPGPVHLNARARKPLEPAAATDDASRALREQVDRLLSGAATRAYVPALEPAPAAIGALASDCRSARRGLLVAGPSLAPSALDARRVSEFLGRTGFISCLEATSQLRFQIGQDSAVLDAFDVLFSSPDFCRALEPDLIVQVGAPCSSIALERFLSSHPETPRWVLAPHGWPDPQSAARGVVLGDVGRTFDALLRELDAGPPPEPEVARARRALAERVAAQNAGAWRVVDETLAAGGPLLSEGVAVALSVRALPEGGLLALGNSLPVREIDRFCRASRSGYVVHCQRGTNGIDGVLSAAAGAAAVARRPATLLVGDVSFLHDVGGLWCARSLQTPFVVVVIDNDGGRIFEQLPLASLPGVGERTLDAWLTPHGLDLTHAGRLFDLPTQRVESAAELRGALAEAHARAGASLIVARVPSHSARDLERLVGERLKAELGESEDRAP